MRRFFVIGGGPILSSTLRNSGSEAESLDESVQ